ncbi:hypothetical protein IW262DRAFT_127323 [Armillaria fumosa]|nr:hypothetical protein IW262DRAFT_127323 [Armillaria fumosa]
MLPHFGEYIAFKLDPVASLKALNDPEVTKSCEGLETITYVSCVTYLLSFPLSGVQYISVSMALLSNCLPKDDPDRFITSDMSVPVLPNTSSPLSRPPLKPSTPLPWPDCYHPTQSRTQCRVLNDVVIGGGWPKSKYGLSSHDQDLFDGQYFDEDSYRGELLKTDKNSSNDSSIDDNVAAERETLERDTDSQHCESVSAGASQLSLSVGTRDSCSVLDAESQHSNKASQSHITQPPPVTVSTSILSFLSKLLSCMSCLRADIDVHEEVASISPSDPIWSHPIFGTRPPDTILVIAVLDNLEAIKP